MKKKLPIIWILLVGTVVYVMFQGHRGQSEFSPETFQYRARWGYNIPHTDIALIRFESARFHPEIVKYWMEKGYLPKPKSKTRIWHTITEKDSSQRHSWGGYAKGFWMGMAGDDARSYWSKWSEKHPEVARRIWPMIITCLKATVKSDRHLCLYSAAQFLLTRMSESELDAELHKIVDEWKAEVEKTYPDLRLKP